MASRRTTTTSSKPAKPRSAAEAVRQFTVVLEEIRAQNRVFGEGQQLLGEQMQLFGEQMQVLRERVQGLGDEVQVLGEQMQAGFARVDRRFEQVDQRFEHIEHRVGRLEDAVLENRREIRLLRGDVNDLAAKKADREEVEALVARAVGRPGGSH